MTGALPAQRQRPGWNDALPNPTKGGHPIRVARNTAEARDHRNRIDQHKARQLCPPENAPRVIRSLRRRTWRESRASVLRAFESLGSDSRGAVDAVAIVIHNSR